MKLLKTSSKLYSGILFLFILLISIIIFPVVVSAEEISLQEAIRLGLRNNNEIQDAQKNVDQLKRHLDYILAGEDWQINMEAGYSYFDRGVEHPQGESSGDTKSLGISASKSFRSGLKLSPSVEVMGDDFEPNFSLIITQPLWPSLPTEQAKNFFKTEKELMKAGNNLVEQKADSILTWLQSYLSITRLIDKQKVYQQSVEKAEDNLDQVLQRKAIGDAGENDLLTARLSLENARYLLQEAKNNLEDARYTLASNLGLTEEKDIVLTDSNQFIEKLRQKAQDISEKHLGNDRDTNMLMVEKGNHDLEANLINRNILNQELEWLEKEDSLNVDLSGSYSSDIDEFKIGVNALYLLYDGGQHKIDLQEKEIEIADNKEKYSDLYNQLKLQLKQHVDNIELSEMSLQKEELNFEKSKLELDIAEQQLEVGLIDYLEYQEYWISAAEAEIKLDSLQDQLLLDRLELIKFINLETLDELMGGL